MTEPLKARFVDAPIPQQTHWESEMWEPLIIPKEQLDEQIERLADMDAPDGRRRTLIVHPRSTAPGLGLSPGIQMALEVLRPGERTPPIRHSSSSVTFCLEGTGQASIGSKDLHFGKWDTCYVPALNTYTFANNGTDLQVRLTASTAPVLEKLGVHFVDDGISPEAAGPKDGADGALEVFGGVDSEEAVEEVEERGFAIGDGAYLMSYEQTLAPVIQRQPPLHWPWERISAELQKLADLGQEYHGRRLFLLYNPATGRHNGTSPTLISTITIRPAEIVDRPHRHAAAAMNYFFQGSGWSRVGGKRYEWKAGDLMFTAPGWMVHNHASGPEPVHEITWQDFPLHMAMDSLLWQEDLKKPIRLLGTEGNVRTNLEEIRSNG